MFDKSNNIKRIEIKKADLYRSDKLLLSSSFIDMISYYHSEEDLKIENLFQEKVTDYINKKEENEENKEYNPTIVNLYHNGIIVINSEEYKIKDFYIVFNDKQNNFHLKCIDKRINNENIDYNKAVKYIDSTAFINLINRAEIKDNKIICDINTLYDTINTWDGYLHNEVSETDAIFDRKMIKDDVNG